MTDRRDKFTMNAEDVTVTRVTFADLLARSTPEQLEALYTDGYMTKEVAREYTRWLESIPAG